MKLNILAAICMLLATSHVYAEVESNSTSQDSAYVSDDLTIFIHTGPSRNYRISGTIIAGTQLEILANSEDNSFSQVKTQDNKSGWIESQYISRKTGQKQQIAQLSQSLETTKSELIKVQENLNQEASDNQALKQDLAKSEQTLADTTARLNQTQLQLTALQTERNSELENVRMDWLVKGGILSLGSLLLGFALAFMPRRKKRSSEWA
ncbi:TIGR04211 family SH3 domain-containing protein [Catenovulum maritimum]|uniref:SH3b domain-containing protein n=1 Tax=Catenovulum maritimum TaxID=1513271 RepID=A0A0J8GNL8_9ALTE|nr:TIGR04211 family SH3 domain-containing protein [Catenovulum maritimum]KMT64382.1 hypothetical protein XM47_14465 [Catenovulum maritimum]